MIFYDNPMEKELLKKFYLLQEAVRNTEREIFNPKYFEWSGFTWFEDVRDIFYALYKEFDPEEYSVLESLDTIMSDEWYWDFKLLTKEHLEKYSTKFTRGTVEFAEWEISARDSEWVDEGIMMSKAFKEECKYCFVPLKTLDEALDFMQEKWWTE